MREVVAETERPVMLYSVGRLRGHAAPRTQHFFPATPPFSAAARRTRPGNSSDVRDARAGGEGERHAAAGPLNPEAKAKGINPFDQGPCTPICEDEGLKQALDKYRFDAAFGGRAATRRRSRQERVFSFRSFQSSWTRNRSVPTMELYKHEKQGESLKGVPIVDWTELDIWQYIHLEKIPIVPLYLRHPGQQ